MRRALVTGGAGFIGSNACGRLLRSGWEVTALDNLSRPGSARNLAWLRETPGFRFVEADVRDAAAMKTGVAAGAPWDLVLHLAGQVAVTTSVADPRTDFEINALGTLNVLEAVRGGGGDPVVVFASTNKVYGGLEALDTVEQPTRYALPQRPEGIDESYPLDFHSPYGCSKGAADQYVRDYHRIYGTRTVVFRQSCVYGPRQFGVEDQGWLAHFLISHLEGRTATVYGDGKQVRDVLHVNDLLDAYLAAFERSRAAAGQVFNIGGGARNTLSIVEAFDRISALTGRPIERRSAPTRPGDQRVFVSDNGKAERVLGWRPRTSVEDGLRDLLAWVTQITGKSQAGVPA